MELIERDSKINEWNNQNPNLTLTLPGVSTHLDKVNPSLKEAAKKAYDCVLWHKYTGFNFLKELSLYGHDQYRHYKWSERIGIILAKKHTVIIALSFAIICVTIITPLIIFR